MIVEILIDTIALGFIALAFNLRLCSALSTGDCRDFDRHCLALGFIAMAFDLRLVSICPLTKASVLQWTSHRYGLKSVISNTASWQALWLLMYLRGECTHVHLSVEPGSCAGATTATASWALEIR